MEFLSADKYLGSSALTSCLIMARSMSTTSRHNLLLSSYSDRKRVAIGAVALAGMSKIAGWRGFTYAVALTRVYSCGVNTSASGRHSSFYR